ncbi:hypothetical protein SADUNF_Sadunf03G0141100 [Salix dunnii]|uniref:Uncharacterized protein n=1 Tax=Salix dunnii TaxID=1413687 RepID=A0A835THE0_9ROSI|nr:hypothetical protein SADUNF_Sadunf03G0141100 [Salix dunnii]
MVPSFTLDDLRRARARQRSCLCPTEKDDPDSFMWISSPPADSTSSLTWHFSRISQIFKSLFIWNGSRALSTDTISFSVSVKLVKKLPNRDTIGAAYERDKPTCNQRYHLELYSEFKISGIIYMRLLLQATRIWEIKRDKPVMKIDKTGCHTSPGVPKLIVSQENNKSRRYGNKILRGEISILYLILKINSNMVLVLCVVRLLGQTIDVMQQGGKEDELITYIRCAFHIYKFRNLLNRLVDIKAWLTENRKCRNPYQKY